MDISKLVLEGEKFEKDCINNDCFFKNQKYYFWLNKIVLFFENSEYLNLPIYKKFLSIYEKSEYSIDSYNQTMSILRAIKYNNSKNKNLKKPIKYNFNNVQFLTNIKNKY